MTPDVEPLSPDIEPLQKRVTALENTIEKFIGILAANTDKGIG